MHITNIYRFGFINLVKLYYRKLDDIMEYIGSFLSPGIRRCNRLRCPLARLSGLQLFNMGHNAHGINRYGVVMILMGN